MANQVLPLIRVTEIGEFIRHNGCERRFKLGFNKREKAKELPFAERLFNSLDPVLQLAGEQREAEWERSLRDGHGFTCLNQNVPDEEDTSQLSWGNFKLTLSQLPTNQDAYAREVELEGAIGNFRVQGRVDFIVITWSEGTPKIRLVECKASRKDRTYHRVQVALYKILLEELINSQGLSTTEVNIPVEAIEAVVARIDESTNEGQQILQLIPLDLEVISSDIERTLAGSGPLARILEIELDQLTYKLEPKCDGCIFSVHCLTESARLRRLELIGLDPSDIRVLAANGILTIDGLADLDLESDAASGIRSSPGFSGGLDIHSARAGARRSTLPGGGQAPDEYQVQPLPNRWNSQLPLHSIGGQRVVRVYLSVDYDYTENRIGALSAHITTSIGKLKTGFEQVEDRWITRNDVYEIIEDANGERESEVSGLDIIRFKTSQWTGVKDEDNGSERELIQGFIHELIDGLSQVAENNFAIIHFYVWSRSEISHLVEGCTRGGSDLLAHVKELLGCRESLEQLIFSSVSEEVNNRYALGWTSRGLSAVSSLRWFGEIYHWSRKIGRRKVDLDRIFTQDIFDFKTELFLHNNEWSTAENQQATKHKFEIRSRFFDSLPAPYWHAVWRTLPNPRQPDLDRKLKNAIERYNQAALPSMLREYLKARTHALRWVEERITFKNEDIIKSPLDIQRLIQFNLGIDSVSASALDFLELEQHMKASQWIATHLVAPNARVTVGRTIPITNIRVINGSNELNGEIDLNNFDITLEELSSRSILHEGGFARMIPYQGNPERPQTVNQLHRAGSTCRITELDWDNGTISLSVIPLGVQHADQYRLPSFSYNNSLPPVHATLDESITDFVARRVATQLSDQGNAPTYRWFDPMAPRLPEQPELNVEVRRDLDAILQRIRFNNNHSLSIDQRNAILEGLDTTVQLLQGPPGTGKTQTTAVAILIRALRDLNENDIILVLGNTHTAVDNLLERIIEVQNAVREAVEVSGQLIPAISVAKVHSTEIEDPLNAPLLNFRADRCARDVSRARQHSILILGGTTGTMLKMATTLSNAAAFRNGFSSNCLIIDEASMMVFPYFLSLTSLLSPESKIMLAGDHRQLAPILSHDWEQEDRPPVVLYQPFFSAYDSVMALYESPAVTSSSVKRSALQYTYRLPPLVRSLIAQLYRRDDIELQGPNRNTENNLQDPQNTWEQLWGGSGLFLVVHNERESRKRNTLEATIIRNIMAASGVQPDDSVAVITPHRAQRTLLKAELEEFANTAPIIDTVERLQGGQKPTIIISATASDPTAIADSVEFVLDLNRSNVAFSRVQNRLIVVCSESLLNHMAPEIEHYESAMLWKSLRAICSERLGMLEVEGFAAEVFHPSEIEIANVYD